MSDFSLNSLYGRSAGDVSGLDYTNMKNKLYSTRITGLLGSVKKTNSVFSPAFLLQINDSKLVTPKIINNYLKKADEAYGTKIEEDSKRVRHKTFVDEILDKYS